VSHDNVFALKNPAVPDAVHDALTEVLQAGARTLLAQAIEAEVAEFLARHADQRDAAGRLRLVRNGYLPERTIQTGIGDVPVKAPRVRDRAGELRFSSSILPPYLRRTKTVNYCPNGATDGRRNGASLKWYFSGLGRVLFYFVLAPFATACFSSAGRGLGLR
jgi:hypothetical protein